jgi:hypothetical protein
MEDSDPLAPSPLSQPTASSPREQLSLPETVSIRWLVERVPVSWWFWAASGVVAIFSFGFTAGLRVESFQQLARPSEHSSEYIEKIRQLQQALRDATRQEKTLRMPLEGVWDYKTLYTKYFGEDNTNPKKPQLYLNGKAIFIWNGDSKRVGYEAYMGQEYTK